jgi:hypothetical protein
MYKTTDKTKQTATARPRSHIHTPTVLALLFSFLFISTTFADEIFFKSGYSQTGVVVRETDEKIRFRTEMGLSTISREKIEFVEKATPKENRLMLKKWRDKELKRKAESEARREADRKFEEEQRAKGLLEFEGQWMPPSQKQEILHLRKSAHNHRSTFEAKQEAKGLVQFEHIWVTQKLADELSEMEPEINRLHDDISAQEEKLDSFRSAMLNTSSLEEIENFSTRIEETTKSITDNIEKLNKLLKRADEIEATGVTYKIPEKFLDVLGTETAETE